jgi:hypothetical protein
MPTDSKFLRMMRPAMAIMPEVQKPDRMVSISDSLQRQADLDWPDAVFILDMLSNSHLRDREDARIGPVLLDENYIG